MLCYRPGVSYNQTNFPSDTMRSSRLRRHLPLPPILGGPFSAASCLLTQGIMRPGLYRFPWKIYRYSLMMDGVHHDSRQSHTSCSFPIVLHCFLRKTVCRMRLLQQRATFGFLFCLILLTAFHSVLVYRQVWQPHRLPEHLPSR